MKKKDIVKKAIENNPEDFKGFEEVVDILDFEDENIKKKGGITQDKGVDSFHLYSFLDQELNRLNLLDQFFTFKFSNIEDYSPTEKLIQMQSIKLHQAREELTAMILEDDSTFLKRMEFLWNSSIGGNN